MNANFSAKKIFEIRSNINYFFFIQEKSIPCSGSSQKSGQMFTAAACKECLVKRKLTKIAS